MGMEKKTHANFMPLKLSWTLTSVGRSVHVESVESVLKLGPIQLPMASSGCLLDSHVAVFVLLLVGGHAASASWRKSIPS